MSFIKNSRMSFTIPFIKNQHSHASFFAALTKGLDIGGIDNKEEALVRMKECQSDFTLVFGWNNSRFDFEPEELEDFPPILICNVSFHKFLMSRKARQSRGRDFRDVVKNLEYPGWGEKNLPRILQYIVKVSGLSPEDIQNYYDLAGKQGTGFIEDNLLPDPSVIDLFDKAGCLGKTRFWADVDTYLTLDNGRQTHVTGIKVFLDGALGAGTAALSKGYLSGHKGLLMYSPEELSSVVAKISELDRPVSFHAIGDAAVDQLISTLEAVKYRGNRLPSLIRMEHCQFISLDMACRARKLGIVLCMQPNFSLDSIQYRDRISRDYSQRNNPFRMLIDDAGFLPGKDLIFGTDDPNCLVEYALQTSLFPPLSSQRLTLDEFVDGFCMPDETYGYVEVEIDRKTGIIQADVRRPDFKING